MKYKRLTEQEAFKENPFIEKAIQDVRIVKRQQVIRPKNRDEIQQIVSTDGEVTGYTAFTRFIEVDEEKFAKVYLSQFAFFWELSKPAIKVFGYILTVLQPKKDTFIFRMDDCLRHTGYTHRNNVLTGLASLVECNIIARSVYDWEYFINPLVVFNGDRVAFTKMYVKKKKDKEKANTSQLDLFQQEALQLSRQASEDIG
ncbi:replication/maintenance protein RepL [Spirosoma pulveris]